MNRVGFVLAALVCVACGGSTEVESTVATVMPVRGGAQLEGADVTEVARATASSAVQTAERSVARVSLDLGPQLLLGASTELSVLDASSVELRAGRLFAEVQPGEQLEARSAQGSLRCSDASFSAELSGETLHVHVVRGEVSWSRGEERGIASAGQELTLTSAAARVNAASLWHDWTGGLARPGPVDASVPQGMGMLEARVPDEVGLARWPLVIRRLDVRVRVEGDLAVTEVDQLFFNPASEAVEGLYRIQVPDGAVLQRFAVDRDDRLVDGYVRERAQARQAYDRQVYRGSTEDPALLEWDAPGSYRARIYPIYPGETRRIVIRYAEWLHPPAPGAPRLYRYPMGGGARAPHIQELFLSADVAASGAERVRAGMGAQVEEGAVRIRRSDFRPRADFWMELVGGEGATQRAWTAEHEPPPRAPDARAIANEADERDYFFLPLVLPAALAPAQQARGLDLVIVADASAATDRSHLELGRSVAESLSAHLDGDDRVAIVSSDLAIRSVIGDDAPALVPATADNIERLLDGLARTPAGGATDLGQALAQAAALLDPARPGAVIYVGDGAPTVGELQAEGLLARLARLPNAPRLYAVAVGSDANLELLEALTRGGGLALRVEERAQAADAALRVFAHLERPVAHGVEVVLGDGIENAFPRRPMDAVLGEVFPVVGRVRGALPTSVTVRGTIGGQPFEQSLAIEAASTEASTDLRLRWAAERLRQLLLEGAGREEVAELGTRYGLITPFTSYYVPSRRELAQMGGYASQWIDQPLLETRTAERDRTIANVLAFALGPLSIAGCSFSESEPAASRDMALSEAAEIEETRSEADDEGGQGQRAQTAEAVAPAATPLPTPTMPSAAPMAPPMDAPAEPAPEAAAEPTTGALLGDMAGAQVGIGGLGLTGTGRGGGGESARENEDARLEVLDPFDGNEGPRRARRPAPSVRMGAAQPEGRLDTSAVTAVIRSRMGEIQLCHAQRPGVSGRATLRIVVAPSGAVQNASLQQSTLGDAMVEQCILRTVRAWTFPPPADGGTLSINYPIVFGGGAAHQTRFVSTTTALDHQASRCSDAADLSLDDRRALWRERLSRESAAGWVRLYGEAVQQCEARSWRDRRAFLALVLERAGSVESMLTVYRLLDAPAARDYVRSQIFRRVRSPEDLRQVRAAFGLGSSVDWVLVEQILARATDPAARIRALRRLSWQYPESFDLKLRLLAALEQQSLLDEAKRLARRMRLDPMADPGVRTAIGELYLRLGREDEARRAFSEIVEFAPLDELARRRLGDLYRAHGWYEDAYRQYQTLREIRPDDLTAQLLLAQAAAGAGRVDEALRLEQGLMQTAQTGASEGIARTALLWSSVRFARLRKAARDANDTARMEALSQRLRRSGVLREARALRVALVWSHPDAQLSLWAGFPGLSLTRPNDITPDLGLEAFELEEQEPGTYSFQVRRMPDPNGALTTVTAQLVVIWNEGREDEKVELVDLTFDAGRSTYAWTLTGRTLTEAAR
jgi:Ca-activated chloride channel family protein